MLKSSNTPPVSPTSVMLPLSGSTSQPPHQPKQEVPSSNPLQQAAPADAFTRRPTKQSETENTPGIDANDLLCGLLGRKSEITPPEISQQNWFQDRFTELACGLNGR